MAPKTNGSSGQPPQEDEGEIKDTGQQDTGNGAGQGDDDKMGGGAPGE
ncbi:hypothetical protein [Streptomyces sp. NPDC050485]